MFPAFLQKEQSGLLVLITFNHFISLYASRQALLDRWLSTTYKKQTLKDREKNKRDKEIRRQRATKLKIDWQFRNIFIPTSSEAVICASIHLCCKNTTRHQTKFNGSRKVYSTHISNNEDKGVIIPVLSETEGEDMRFVARLEWWLDSQESFEMTI